MRALILTIAFFTLLFLPISIEACSCMTSGPPCQSYWNTLVVFSGRVVEIKSYTPETEDKRFRYEQKLVRFAVNEGFRGISGQTTEIVTGQGGGDCGFAFEVNESYLVYAYTTNDNKLSTGICTRTQLLSKAGEDIEYINSLSAAKPLGSISGVVRQYRQLRADDEWRHSPPMANINVAIEGKSGKIQATTDDLGKFRHSELAAGDYIVSLLAPEGFYPFKIEQKVKVVEKGCAILDFVFERNTSLSGKILNENGQSAGKMMVNLVPVELINEKYQKDHYFVEADEGGMFTFRSIPSGKYYLGFRLDRITGQESSYPRTFYPGTQNLAEAATIVIGEGQVQENFNFQLPAKLTQRKIEGIVVFPDGKPAGNASICFEEAEYSAGSICRGGDEEIGTDGRFSFIRLNGLSYRIRAHVNTPTGQRHAEPVKIPSKGNVRNLKIVVSEPNGNCARCNR